MNRKACLFSITLNLLMLGSVQAQIAPNVQVRAPDGEVARALDPIEFTAIVSLPSADPGDTTSPTGPVMSINSISVVPGGLLAEDYAESATCQFQQQGLSVGQQLEFPCILYPKKKGVGDRLLPSLSALFAKSLILQTEVVYMRNDTRYDRSDVARITVLPPIVAVFFGGMTGALMLALFRGLAPLRHGLSSARPRLPTSRREVSDLIFVKVVGVARALTVTFAWLVLGGISAIMIIILSKASAGELSPVQIEIKDFVGGVLVGLLSFPVVDWLERRLVASEVSARPQVPDVLPPITESTPAPSPPPPESESTQAPAVPPPPSESTQPPESTPTTSPVPPESESDASSDPEENSRPA